MPFLYPLAGEDARNNLSTSCLNSDQTPKRFSHVAYYGTPVPAGKFQYFLCRYKNTTGKPIILTGGLIGVTSDANESQKGVVDFIVGPDANSIVKSGVTLTQTTSFDHGTFRISRAGNSYLLDGIRVKIEAGAYFYVGFRRTGYGGVVCFRIASGTTSASANFAVTSHNNEEIPTKAQLDGSWISNHYWNKVVNSGATGHILYSDMRYEDAVVDIKPQKVYWLAGGYSVGSVHRPSSGRLKYTVCVYPHNVTDSRLNFRTQRLTLDGMQEVGDREINPSYVKIYEDLDTPAIVEFRTDVPKDDGNPSKVSTLVLQKSVWVEPTGESPVVFVAIPGAVANPAAKCYGKNIGIGEPIEHVSLSNLVLYTVPGENEGYIHYSYSPSNADFTGHQWSCDDRDPYVSFRFSPPGMSDNYAKVTAKGKVGTTWCRITVKDNGYFRESETSATCRIEVRCYATKVKIMEWQSRCSLNENETKSFQFKARVTPDEAYDKTVYWETSDPTIATVNANGVVTAVGPGVVTITAKAKATKNTYVSDSVQMVVSRLATSIEIESEDLSIDVGEVVDLPVKILPDDVTDKRFSVRILPSKSRCTAIPKEPALSPLAVKADELGACRLRVSTIDGTGLSAEISLTVNAPEWAVDDELQVRKAKHLWIYDGNKVRRVLKKWSFTNGELRRMTR